MAILDETMIEIADAIREKTGKSELIKPIDFATEIKGITAGGGGSGESGGGLSYFAIDISILGADVAFIYGSFLGKVVLPEGSTIQPTTLLIHSMDENLLKGLKAIATDVNAKVYIMGELKPLWGGLADTIEWFISNDILTPITEAEFYDLNTELTPQEITFTVSGVEYTALSGMTWEEFCNSEYNDGGWGKLFFDCEALGDGLISASDSGMDAGIVQLNGSNVYKTDAIQPNANYTTSNPLG